MALTDHINLTGSTRSSAPTTTTVGPRFPAWRDAYDPELRERLHARRRRAGVDAARGRLPRGRRPELRDAGRDPRVPHARRRRSSACRTVPEAIAARHCGLRVAAVSGVTNLAEGMGDVALSHEQTLEEGKRGAGRARPARPAPVVGGAQ